MRVTIPFTGPSFQSRSSNANAQRTVNLYPKRESPGAKNVIGLYHTPGLKFEVSAETGPCRSNFVKWKGASYHVNGNKLVKIDSNNTVTLIGTLNTTGGWVVIARGRTHIAMVDGTNGYSYDGTTFGVIVDADFPDTATYITNIDARFVVNNADSDQWQISDDGTPIDWGALNFATAEYKPDDAFVVESTNSGIYIIGDETTQVYYNSGNVDFPFDLYPNGKLDVGIAAQYSIANGKGDGLFFLAQDGDGDSFVVRMMGTQYQRVSDSDLEQVIGKMSTTSDAEGYVYRQEGRKFYILTFPAEDQTWVYDLTENLWHERKSWGLGRHRMRGTGFFNGKVWTGDYQTGRVYSLSLTTYQDDGNPIERIRRAQYIHKDRRPITVNEFEVVIETGTTPLVSGQGSDPKAMLTYHIDGGHIPSNELHADIGKQGQFENHLVWYQLGDCGDQFMPEIKITDPIPVAILFAVADIELGQY